MKKLIDWLIGRRGYEYFAAPLLALAILCAAFAARGVWPFGDLSVAIWDMDIQYIGLFGWLSNVMHGQGSLAYSFSAGMGEGMASTFAYYLASPFNLLAWFFDAGHAPQLMSVLTLAKLSTAALTCYAFLRKRHRAGFIHVVLGVAYALCGWAVAQCSNIMWLDGLIMLPLVALGTWRTVAQGRCLTLFLSVAGAVLFNWYTGYMDCLFSVLYFFVCWLSQPREQVRVRQGLRYGATMVLGIGASLVLFLPAVVGLLGSKEGGGSLLEGVFSFALSLNPLKLFSSFAVTATPASDWDVMPALYTGELSVVLAEVYLLNRHVDRRERGLHAALLGIVIFSMCFWGTDQIWSSFKHVTSYYFRYAYVASFALVVLAARGWESLEEFASRERLALSAFAAGVSCLLIGGATFGYVLYKGQWVTRPANLALTMALLVAYALIVWLAGEGSRTRARAALVCACVAASLETGYNAYSVFSHYGRSVGDWGAYIGELSEACDSVPSGEGGSANRRVAFNGFSFRGEGSGHVTTTESYLLGVSSPEEYTSTMSAGMPDLLSKLGYCATNEVFGYYYNAPMTLSDALLGIDYTIAPAQPSLADKVSDVTLSGFSGYSLWKSSVAMPAAYGIRSGAGDVAWPSASASDFANQDELYNKENVYQWQGFQPVRDPFANQAAMLADMTGESADGVYHEAEIVEDESAASADSRTWTVTAAADGPLYLHVPIMTTLRRHCDVLVDGQFRASVGGNFDNSVICLGELSAGQSVSVTVRTVKCRGQQAASRILGDSETGDLLVAKTLDLDGLTRLLGLLDANAAQIDTYEDGHVKLSFSAEADETLCTVIPYDAGWTVTVDGKKTEVRSLYGGLCGVDLTAGEHTVEFRYVTPGLAAGCAGSTASVAVFAIWRGLARRRGGAAPRNGAAQ